LPQAVGAASLFGAAACRPSPEAPLASAPPRPAAAIKRMIWEWLVQSSLNKHNGHVCVPSHVIIIKLSVRTLFPKHSPQPMSAWRMQTRVAFLLSLYRMIRSEEAPN
jgi:hypothetical protein